MKLYNRITYEFPNAIEVYEYLDGRYGARGMPREKLRQVTPEMVAKRNQWNKERRARHRLRMYFDVNDYFSDFTYRKDARPPNMATAKEHYRKAIRKIRKEYQKRGYELYWLRNIEVGTKNGWHIHVCINRIPDTDIILAKAWPYGRVINQLMYEKGEFAELAAYITKTPATDPRLKDASFQPSRNMPLPEPKKKKVKRLGKPKEKEGFYLDKPSFHEGTNKFTGYPYRCYTLLRYRRI